MTQMKVDEDNLRDEKEENVNIFSLSIHSFEDANFLWKHSSPQNEETFSSSY